MTHPKSLIFQLHKHWEVVEALVRAAREYPAFRTEQVLAVAGRVQPGLDQAAREEVVRSLLRAEILQAQPRTDDLLINPLVVDFVRGLTREHELGLASVLRARIDGMREALQAMNEGLDRADNDRVRQAAGWLAELIRQIRLQLENDKQAIMQIAEDAKSADSQIPLRHRYRRVLEAYDQYIEPMNQLMDTGPQGVFRHHLEAVEATLDRVLDWYIAQGALYSHRLQIRQVSYQAKALRREGRLIAQQCADTLFPLREEVRQNDALASAVSGMLGEVRRKGLRRALARRADVSSLPVWYSERGTRISAGDEIREVMARALAFEPAPAVFSEDVEPSDLPLPERVDEQALRRALLASLPVDDLLAWLRNRCPGVSDATLLRLCHDLSRDETWQVRYAGTRDTITLEKIRVTHHPWSLHES
ncbi:MAG: hypothetical protein D6758_11075 [Gammaproteobacteria bacterium]|nr:MAG: hypothetical protein D6758_11075 [Gammaproteobacteria bacterium]